MRAFASDDRTGGRAAAARTPAGAGEAAQAGGGAGQDLGQRPRAGADVELGVAAAARALDGFTHARPPAT